MTFSRFKHNEIVVSIFEQLDVDKVLMSSIDMDDLRDKIRHLSANEYEFSDRAEKLYLTLKPGEKFILEAILMKCDFARLADDLANGVVWTRLADLGFADVSGNYADAVCSCIEADVK